MSSHRIALSKIATILLVNLPLAAFAKPQSLVPLKRLTVGPYDNLQGVVNDDETLLYYTRSENLSSRLYESNLVNGNTKAISEVNADAKNPAISPNNKRLAFTYFKNDAKGDICLTGDEGISCISKRGEADHAPVWIDDNRLLYLIATDASHQTRLMLFNIATNTTTEIVRGDIHAPDIAGDRDTVVYSGRKNELVLFELRTKKPKQTITIDLPGTTGPARFSSDQRYLYFAQYMVDSNRDLLLNGSDSAAIFRIDLQASGNAAQPLQITSVDQNCSFPFPGKKSLFMTCAFEGALDVYRGPLTGTVPENWNEQDLLEAHQVARSYSERILFLNQLYVRHNKLNDDEYSTRILQNFLFAGEYQPLLYYIDRLITKKPQDPKWQLWRGFFSTYARWELLPQKQNLGSFATDLMQAERELNKFKTVLSSKIVSAYLSYFANRTQSAKNILLSLDPSDEIDRYLAAQLAKAIVADPAEYFESRIIPAATSTENKLFYLAEWLKLIPPGTDPSRAIKRLRPKLESPVLEVLENELDLYALTNATDSKSTIAAYRPIVNRLNKLKNDYYSSRMIFSRSIIVLSQAKRSRDIADIVSLWKSFLKRDSKEFPYAMIALRQTSTDIAYQFMHAKEIKLNKFAMGAFLDSIRTSDDLEAHYQYALLNFGMWSTLTTNYDAMIKQGLIVSESKDYTESLNRMLNTSRPLRAEDYASEVSLIAAIDDGHVGVAAKYLYLGFLMQKQLATDVFHVQQEIAEAAHQHYTFALDAAVQNERLRAAALQNLAILHMQVRNFSLAADYFTQRMSLGFSSDEEQQIITWLAASANYKSGKSSEAWLLMKAIVPFKAKNKLAFSEKAAFYAWNAGAFQEAIDLYKTLKADRMSLPTRLGYGFALLKARDFVAGKAELNRVIADSTLEGSIVSVEDGEIKTQPLKFKFIALGLIAQSTHFPQNERAQALRVRLKLFDEIVDQANVFHFDEQTLRDQEIKEWLDFAGLTQDQTKEAMETVINKVTEFGDSYGFVNNTVLTALKNSWLGKTRALLPPTKSIEDAVDEEFTNAPVKSALLVRQWAEYKIIACVTHKTGSAKVFKHKAVAELKTSDPETFQYLQDYARYAAQ